MEASPSSVLARRMTRCPYSLARQPQPSLRSYAGQSNKAQASARVGSKAVPRCPSSLQKSAHCRATAAASQPYRARASGFTPGHKYSRSSLRREANPSSPETSGAVEPVPVYVNGGSGLEARSKACAHVNGETSVESRPEAGVSSLGSGQRHAASASDEQRSHGSEMKITSRAEQGEEEGQQGEEEEEDSTDAEDLVCDPADTFAHLLAEFPGQGGQGGQLDEDLLAGDETLSLPSSHKPATGAGSQDPALSVVLPSEDTAPAAANQGQGRTMALQAKAFGSGLLRSPTTGGVQSATSAHGLPDPAVAVRNLVAQTRQGHLCTVMSRMAGRRRGYPFGAMVAFATDLNGLPIFSLSPLEIHARNLLADPRCTLVVQIPGWSGLADARVTLFGDVYPLAPEHQEWANRIFRTRHHQKTSEKWGNSLYFRMERICDVYFVGGFGTVAWVPVEDYTAVQPDKIASEDSEETLEALNSRVADRVRDSLSSLVREGAPRVESVTFIAVDGKGVDLRIHQGGTSNVRRLSFDCARAVETVEEAQAALEDVLQREALPASLVD